MTKCPPSVKMCGMEITKTYTLYRKDYGDTNSAEYGFGDYANISYEPLAYTEASTESEATRKFKRHFNQSKKPSDWSVQESFTDDRDKCFWGQV